MGYGRSVPPEKDSGVNDPANIIVPLSPQYRPAGAPSTVDQFAGEEGYFHVTLANTALDWPDGIARINFAFPVKVLKIQAATGDALWIAYNNSTVTPNAKGGYDYHHPGGGISGEQVPGLRSIALTTATGGVPLAFVDVIGLAGPLAQIPQ